MSPEECAKQTIKESLELDGSIDENALMRVVAQVCGKATSVSLPDTPTSVSAASMSARKIPASFKKGGRRTSLNVTRPVNKGSLLARSASLQPVPSARRPTSSSHHLEHRTSRPKSAKQEEQALFESLRREVADAQTLAEMEDTIDHISETLDDGATRIPREVSRLEGLLKKAENRLRKDNQLRE